MEEVAKFTEPPMYFTYGIRYLIDSTLCDVLVISIVCIDCAMCHLLLTLLGWSFMAEPPELL